MLYFGKGVDGKLRSALVVDAHFVQAVDYAFRLLSVLVPLEHIFYNRRFNRVYSPTLVHDVIAEQLVSADEITL